MAAVKYWYLNATDLIVTVWFAVALLLPVSLLNASEVAVSESVISDSPDSIEAADSVDMAGSEPTDVQLLEDRLQSLASFSATFTQDIQGARGQLLERSSGRVSVLRPAFRWQVDEPYPQVIVADEALLKVYDPDLEQLTIRPMDEALNDTPISLLSRDAISLDGDFVITRVVQEDEETYIVIPRGDETLYAEIRLQFSAQDLVSLGILDHLGQFTQISFTPDPDSTVIQSSDFTLEVPPGTDVIGG
jgi:outer membrane lipoprotein carrier protein